jgi:uncharacterized protein YfiM (DUF2279 family)
MPYNRLVKLTLFVLLLSLATVACWRAETPPGPDMAGGVYEYAGYEYFHWNEGLNILIWHDAIANSSCDSSGATDVDTHFVQCWTQSETGQEFAWQIETRDGRTAQFSLDGQSFDLAAGTVFLVTTVNGTVDVQQLAIDLSGVNPENESITRFSLADPDISQFIEAAAPSQ